jgi:protein required for attachment to host cells
MRVRIVVADQAKVRFYDAEHHAGELQLAGELSDPAAHLHNRDLVSDRPGRKSDRTPLQSGRRGAVAHHGVGSDRRPRKREAVLFARHIADELVSAQRAEQFDRLVLMAPPEFLGVLRKALPVALHKMVAAEVAKDLVHESPAAVRNYLPAQSFQTLSGPQA